MQTLIVSSLADLRAKVGSLPPPAAGRVRVFRGQTREYPDAKGEPILLPSLSRRSGSPMYDPAWLGTMMSFAQLESVRDDLVDFHVWAPALVQHYGPGSYFLDVSHDLEVALWFASHEYHERWLTLKAGEEDVRYGVAWSTDIDAGRSPVVYAFDAEPWDGKALPAHGQLVDLLALEPTHRLGARASRLKAQAAALIYSDLGSGAGPNLAPEVSFRIAFDPAFAVAEIADLKWVEDIYPNPARDPLYKALVGFPSVMRLDPARLEQPLTVPFQLTRPLPFEGSPNVRDLGGTGDYASPRRLRFSLKPGPDLHVVQQLLDYVELAQHMTPPLFHAWLMKESAGELELANRRFDLHDALPLILEAPLWTFLPAADSPRNLGRWIQSALPHGIADTIDGRSTRNVYVEISPLDVVQTGGPANDDLLRGIWVVWDEKEYVVTLYRRSDGVGTYNYTVRFRFDAKAGVFRLRDKRRSSGPAAKAARAASLKALFLTLAILRDLSPGWKPPPIYSLMIDERYLPMPLLEPQLATPQSVSAEPYVIPKALDGSRYLRASGGPRETPALPENPAEALRELGRFFPLVKAPHYRAFAGLALAQLNASAGRFDEALEIVRAALPAAQKAGVMVKELEELRGKIRRVLAPTRRDPHVKTARRASAERRRRPGAA